MLEINYDGKNDSRSYSTTKVHKYLSEKLFNTNVCVCNAQQNYLKQYDITLTQFNALRILRGQFPAHCSINLLKERMLDKMSDVSRLVQRLKKAGYVLHKKSKEDKRNVQVKISKKGLDLLETIDKDIHIFDAPFNELEEAELNQLVALLEKLIV